MRCHALHWDLITCITVMLWIHIILNLPFSTRQHMLGAGIYGVCTCFTGFLLWSIMMSMLDFLFLLVQIPLSAFCLGLPVHGKGWRPFPPISAYLCAYGSILLGALELVFCPHDGLHGRSLPYDTADLKAWECKSRTVVLWLLYNVCGACMGRRALRVEHWSNPNERRNTPMELFTE